MGTTQEEWLMMFGWLCPLIKSDAVYAHTGVFSRERDRVVKDGKKKYQMILEMFDQGLEVDVIAKEADAGKEYVMRVLSTNGRIERVKRISPVMQFSEDGRLMASFSSIKEASDVTTVDRGTIARSCMNDGGWISNRDFVFKFVEVA